MVLARAAATGLVHSVLAASTERGECAALIDTANAFDICSAAAAGVVLEKLLWVRCGGNAEHAMRAADLLLQAGGFGVVALDLIDASPAGAGAHSSHGLVPLSPGD